MFIELAKAYHAAWTSVITLHWFEYCSYSMRAIFALTHIYIGVYGALFVAGMVTTVFGMSEMVVVSTCLFHMM